MSTSNVDGRRAATLRFDLVSAESKRDPYPVWAAMREAGPVVRARIPFFSSAWMTTAHASTLAMVKDNSLFVQEARHAGRTGVAGLGWWMPKVMNLVADNMLLKDEPDHRRLRRLVDKAFQRRDILNMRGDIEAVADRILDGFEGADEIDLVEAFSRRLPLEVICELLGLPLPDRALFSRWARTSIGIKGPMSLYLAANGFGRMIDYLRGRIDECRRSPRKGLISELVRAEEDGDQLSEDELLSMVSLLLIAGFETTTHLISDSVVALEQHPDQKAWLLADPAGRIERAVEELARFNSPVQSTKPRYVARDAEFFGQSLKRGEIVLALVGAANADPAEFDRPDQLLLDRFPNPHLVFSSGIHFCLGMQLARVEAQSALTRLYARYPDLSVSSLDRLDWMERFGLRGLKALPVHPRGVRRLAA
ncbi:MAG TPA: cytochrome P450 [Caulobacteraceae bacterium]|jgi:cytochrome P450|nr:cytochrome P450 [Caulobacteraceae bacterium]